MHAVIVGQRTSLAQHLLHHGLRALLVEDAPQRLGVHGIHGVHHGPVGEQIGRKAVAGVQRLANRIRVAEDHGGRVNEANHHAGLGQRIDPVGAHQFGLHLLLAEVGHNILHGKLPLGNADGAQLFAITAGAEEGKGQLLDIVVLVQAGLLQRLFKAFELGRHDARAQIHGRRRVLHGVVVNGHQLLHIMRNGGAGFGGQLRRRRRGCRGKQDNRN